MPKWKKILWIICLFLLIFTGTGTLLGYIYQDEIIEAATSELNHHLKTEIVPEHIEVSFLKRFPYASISLENVYALEAWDHTQRDTLFQFETVYLKFNVLDLYQGAYHLEAAEFINGKTSLITSKLGAKNYIFWETSSAEPSENFRFELKKITLKDIELNWVRENQHEAVNVQIDYLVARGDFSQKEFTLKTSGELDVHDVMLDKLHYLTGKYLNADVSMNVNLENNTYEFSQGGFIIDHSLALNASGIIGQEEYALKFSGNNLDLSAARAIIPAVYISSLTDWETDGSANINIELSKTPQEIAPLIVTSFSVKDGELHQTSTGLELHNLSFNGRYSNGELHNPKSSSLAFDAFKANTAESSFEGMVKMTNFISPKFNAEIAAEGQLNELLDIYPIDTIETVSGKYATHFQLSGTVENIDKPDSISFEQIHSKGSLLLTDATFSLKNSPIQLSALNTSLSLNNDMLDINNFETQFLDAPLHFSGKISNFMNLFASKDKAVIQGNLSVEKVDLNQWKQLSGGTSASKTVLPQNIVANCNLAINQFIFNQLHAENVSAQLLLRNNTLMLRQLYFDALEGKVKSDIRLTEREEELFFAAQGDFQHVNISTLFSTFNNFNQNSIQAEHLKGYASSDYSVSFPILKGNGVDYSRLKLSSSLAIEQGELIQYEPLQEVVTAIEDNKILDLLFNLDDFKTRLKHIKFNQLENELSIENEKLTIPSMNISSSALNISLSGTHTFDNAIDYALDFNLKEVLVKNKDVKTTEYGYIEDDGLGNKQIFVKITGTVEDPVIELDKSAARAYRKEQTRKEVKTAKSILKEEFGMFKNDTTLPNLEEAQQEAEFNMDFGEFSDPDSSKTEAKKQDSAQEQSRWKNIFNKTKSNSNEKKSKFEEWEFEEDDL